MKTCSKMIQKYDMPEPRQCIWPEKHMGKHTPDLTGMLLHGYQIIKQAPSKKTNSSGIVTQWHVIDKGGHERIVKTNHLFRCQSQGIKVPNHTGKGSVDKNGKLRPEYRTVVSHWNFIFNPRTANAIASYKDMPFYDKWNPNKGGSYKTGMQWILDNLGQRPGPKHSLDIIKHDVGFMPGNLRWTLRGEQSSNRRHRTMFLLTLEQHKEALRQLGYGIHKL